MINLAVGEENSVGLFSMLKRYKLKIDSVWYIYICVII